MSVGLPFLRQNSTSRLKIIRIPRKWKDQSERFWKVSYQVGAEKSVPLPLRLQPSRPSMFLLYLLIYFWQCPGACGILVPGPGMEPTSPALEAWSLNHWATREVPKCLCFRIHPVTRMFFYWNRINLWSPYWKVFQFRKLFSFLFGQKLRKRQWG